MSILDKKYSIIFVDFDSTLYLWDNISERSDFPSQLEWNAQCLTGKRQYNPELLNKPLIDFLNQNMLSEIVLATHVKFSFEAEDKFHFVNNQYPGLLDNYVGVSSAEAKLELLQTYEIAGVPKESMLIIDNDPEVVQMCRDAQFDVQEPQYIMAMLQKEVIRNG